MVIKGEICIVMLIFGAMLMRNTHLILAWNLGFMLGRNLPLMLDTVGIYVLCYVAFNMLLFDMRTTYLAMKSVTSCENNFGTG